MNKQELRITYAKIRKFIENKASLSDIITNTVLKTSVYANSKNIGIYVNLSEEVSTKKLILQSFADKKTVSVPVVEGQDINFYTINHLDDLCNTGAFGIKEPIPSKNRLVNKNSIDLLIIPGICFDIYGNRIGSGKRIL